MPRPGSKKPALKHGVTLFSLALGLLLASACGSTPPTAPAPPLQVSGIWLGEQTVTTFTGGECLAPLWQELVGLPSQFRATLTQSGTSVTAVLDIDHTGDVCTYTGSIDGSALTLTSTSCTPSRTLGLSCLNGARRDLLAESGTLHATLNGASMAGIAVERDVVVESGTAILVDRLAADSTVTLTRQ
jgi:hypothetical protein